MNCINHTMKISGMIAVVFMLTLLWTGETQSQPFRASSWRFGVHGALNYNSASLGWQQLHQNPTTGLWEDNFHSTEGNIDHSDGTGYGAYAGIAVEYLSSSWWGVQFRISYDERNALIEDNTRTPIPSFDAKMNYLAFEPFLRVDQHLIPGLNLYVGPFLAANIHGTYTYKPDVNQTPEERDVKITERNIVSYGVQGGLAYDIKAASFSPNASMYVSPFVDCSWIVNQRKSTGQPDQNSTTDIWSTVTGRLGIRLSLDISSREDERITEAAAPIPRPRVVVPIPAENIMTIEMPYENTMTTKEINGYYPILPYVFFEKENQRIPPRYIVLSKGDAARFNDRDLGDYTKGDYSVQETNVGQLMITYYNVMNIYGGRMRNNPKEKLVLRGCDPLEKDGQACAMSVKNYLVTNYDIDPGRITIVVEAPVKPSGSDRSDPAFAGLIDDENRRVVFVFSNEEMLKPIPYTIRDEASIDNDMVFTVRKDVPYKSWSVTITGENQNVRYGPYTNTSARISPAPLMMGRDEGQYRAVSEVVMLDGRIVSESTNIKLHKHRDLTNASRYLMVFDYNKSEAVATYETKIRNEITPGMKVGNTVIVHGHTDIIGNPAANQKLSQERADAAKTIIDDELGSESSRMNVQSVGTGQTPVQYTFNNTYPEGRMYNRNVFVEIIP